MKKILITGGAGFIGINSARYFLKKNFNVIILDNFSRYGTRQNIINFNNEYFPLKRLKIIKVDLRNS